MAQNVCHSKKGNPTSQGVLEPTVPFRLIVQSCVTSNSEMNVPGISSGVTASSEHLLKPTKSSMILQYIGEFGMKMNNFFCLSHLKFCCELCSVVFTGVTHHTL